VANAVFDAVGVRITDLPITGEKIVAALKSRACFVAKPWLWERSAKMRFELCNQETFQKR
jgi:hypothetical protein